MTIIQFATRFTLWWCLLLGIIACLEYGLGTNMFDALAVLGVCKFVFACYCLNGIFRTMGRFGMSHKEMLRNVASSLGRWSWLRQCYAMGGFSLVLGDRFGQGSLSPRRHQRSCRLWARWIEAHYDNLVWDVALQRYVERDLIEESI